MLLDQEQVKRKIQVISDSAWKQPGIAPTVNSMVEFIVRESFIQVIQPELEALAEEVSELIAITTTLNEELEELRNKANASTNGRHADAEGYAKASVKGPRGRPKEARTSLS